MAGTTADRRRPRRQRRGLRRGSLRPGVIVAESLRLLDKEGLSGFSLPKLGRALGADPTAVYRHFASKDDLVLAIADHLIEEAMTGVAPQECWLDTVIDVTRRIRRTFHAHPAAAALSACRTTRRPAGTRVTDVLIGAVLAAGFEGAEAALLYRSLGDFALSWAGGEAGSPGPDEQAQRAGRAAWTRAHPAVDRSGHPRIWQVGEHLPGVGDDEIFETVLSLVISGLASRAPRPCGCAAHAPRPVPAPADRDRSRRQARSGAGAEDWCGGDPAS